MSKKRKENGKKQLRNKTTAKTKADKDKKIKHANQKIKKKKRKGKLIQQSEYSRP